VNPERLAYWYFRLNGFFSTENFIVHPDQGRDQRTDADLLVVRFAHRAENLQRPMEDDPRVASCNTFANVIIAEVKTSECRLNGPWTNSELRNMQRVAKSMGCVPDAAITEACQSLYQTGKWSDASATIRLFAIGETRSTALIVGEEQQLTWSEIIQFCRQRFKSYEREKSSVGQWSEDGRILQSACLGRESEAEVRKHFGLLRRVCNEENGP
jgi:hypothetical protein